MKFSNFFKNRKITIIFEPKLVENHYIDKNLAELSPESTKNSQFFLRNCYFVKISAPSSPKICSFDIQNPDFFS